MLAPEGYGEIIGGSERETDNKKLIELIKKQGGKPEDYSWYLDLRKYGSVPHAGFGLGIERLIMWLCKLDHIRDAIAFPRMINRVYP
jgi:asparaginyl-tRNA synthetase